MFCPARAVPPRLTYEHHTHAYITAVLYSSTGTDRVTTTAVPYDKTKSTVRPYQKIPDLAHDLAAVSTHNSARVQRFVLFFLNFFCRICTAVLQLYSSMQNLGDPHARRAQTKSASSECPIEVPGPEWFYTLDKLWPRLTSCARLATASSQAILVRHRLF